MRPRTLTLSGRVTSAPGVVDSVMTFVAEIVLTACGANCSEIGAAVSPARLAAREKRPASLSEFSCQLTAIRYSLPAVAVNHITPTSGSYTDGTGSRELRAAPV